MSVMSSSQHKTEDCLLELLTEELPPKQLLILAEALCDNINNELQKAGFDFKAISFFATPRRLAVLVNALAETTAEKTELRKGPAFAAAFDVNGKPTPACVGFARSVGVEPSMLMRITNDQGDWMGFYNVIPGESVFDAMPNIVKRALDQLPIAKRMRWGNHKEEFVRPVHRVVMLYGKRVIECEVLGCKTDRITEGHRFLSPEKIKLAQPADYESALKEAFVMADFSARKEKIKKQIVAEIKKKIGNEARFIENEALLNEVTGLVEWPVALCGTFDADFLMLPKEVLIAAMQDHQRYFAVIDNKNNLLPYFITISNIHSKDEQQVIHGNERVLRARLSDAQFFFQVDQEQSLMQRLPQLKNIVYQAKLGTLHDKAERLSQLSGWIADKMKLNDVDQATARRAGLLAKADLTTHMVAEFPELQGIMGHYYAHRYDEDKHVAAAIEEHYLPRFANDELPKDAIGQAVALADRIDNLLGAFGTGQIPTGTKDPYGLRRAALGVIRIIIQKEISLNLWEALQHALTLYQVPLQNKEAVQQVWQFIQERLRAFYQDQGVNADVFASVSALSLHDLSDIDARIKAVQSFKKLNAASALSVANKRVSNILAQYQETLSHQMIDAAYFEHAAEKTLADELALKTKQAETLLQSKQYDALLLALADLRKPVDDFFDHVMVMSEDKKRRDNRIILLSQLRSLFLQVADIALLQSKQ